MIIEQHNNSRNDFVDIINANKYRIGVEIGVAEGNYSKYILSKTGMEIMYMIDPFIPIAADFYCNVNTTTKNLLPYINRCIILPMFSENATQHVANNLADFIYIDGDHSKVAVELDLKIWYPKLKSGGLFAGHDYIKVSQPGVVQAVNDFCIENNIDILHVTGLGKVDEKISGKEGGAPSWYFFKI